MPTGYIMESCHEPWKCQERKGRSEGEKEDGQRKKREEKRKGERMREIALERIFDFALLHIAFYKSRFWELKRP